MAEPIGFHVRDGLCFARIETTMMDGPGVRTADPALFGGVRIQKGDLAMDLTAEEWASVVASVSALGENVTTWNILRALQRGAY